jgi:hypothetical protein
LGYGEVADLSTPASPRTRETEVGKTFTLWESVMSDELDGYTQEEFEAILRVINMEKKYHLAIANGWRKPPMTPRARLDLINRYVLTRKKHGEE